MDLLDLPGPQFLKLYLLLLVAAFVLGIIIPRLMRPAGKGSAIAHDDEMAVLAGGETRLAEAVTARLLASGSIAFESGGRIAIQRQDNARSPAERAVLSLSSPATWEQIAAAMKAEAATIGERLCRHGLMLSQAEVSRARLFQTAPYLLLMAFGAIKLWLGIARDKPVGFLIGLLVVTAIAAMIRYGKVERRTKAGIDAVKAARTGADRLRRAPAGHESGRAVALFGTGVLAGSALSELHDLRASSSSSSGSSGCSSDSSSGCSSDSGGGGCGGCGGGD